MTIEYDFLECSITEEEIVLINKSKNEEKEIGKQ